MKRRLTAGETEILSLGTLTLTTDRVIIHHSHWWGDSSGSVLLRLVESTTVVVPRWGSPRILMQAGHTRLVLRHRDRLRLRGLADAIDHAARAR